MKKSIFSKISLILSLCLVGVIAVYSLVTDYHFPLDQVNYLFSLFYLILSLNFLGEDQTLNNTKERIKIILTKIQSIIITCVLAILFSLILIQSDIGPIKIFIIIFLALVLFNLTTVIFKREITLILFWINFYLFMGIFILSQFPNLSVDLLSRFNPFGGLIVTIFN